MAIIVSSAGNIDTPVAISSEVQYLNFNDQVSATLTPSTILAITNVVLTPTNATAATSLTSTYLNGFVPGASTVTIAGANNATFNVTLYGRI